MLNTYKFGNHKFRDVKVAPDCCNKYASSAAAKLFNKVAIRFGTFFSSLANYLSQNILKEIIKTFGT